MSIVHIFILYAKEGREFDELFIKSVEDLDIERLVKLDANFCENPGECRLRSFLMMFGAVDRLGLRPEVYSYEGPLGVGYSVVKFDILRKE